MNSRTRCTSHGQGRGDRNPSLSLATDDTGRLLVKCFAGCDAREVLAAIRSRGLIGDVPERTASAVLTGKVTRPPEFKKDNTRTKAARRIWRGARPAKGTIAETYLRSRAITIPPPASLRFHSDLWHRESNLPYAVMATAVQGCNGRVVGVHRTCLCPSGGSKAPVKPAKKVLGPSAGGAVRLASAGEALQVTEGIETALAALQATAQPTWVALSTNGLKALVLPPGVQRVTILADGDIPSEVAAQAAAKQWIRDSREVCIARPSIWHLAMDVLSGNITTCCAGVVL